MTRLPTTSHRDTDEPQPEICDLCGLHVGGAHLRLSDVEGLRGQYVCDVTPGCKEYRNRPSWRDRRRWNDRARSTIGDSRVYPPGDEDWAKFTRNILLYSEEFDQAATWLTAAATVTADTDVAPDGETTADTVTDTSAGPSGQFGSIRQTVTVLADTKTYTFSCYFKQHSSATETAQLSIQFGAAPAATAKFDLLNGNVTSSSGLDGSAIVASKDDPTWWRASITDSNASSLTSILVRITPVAHDNAATGSKIAWGAQLEIGTVASTYQCTTTKAQ